jgi:hypothetical protein
MSFAKGMTSSSTTNKSKNTGSSQQLTKNNARSTSNLVNRSSNMVALSASNINFMDIADAVAAAAATVAGSNVMPQTHQNPIQVAPSKTEKGHHDE